MVIHNTFSTFQKRWFRENLNVEQNYLQCREIWKKIQLPRHSNLIIIALEIYIHLVIAIAAYVRASRWSSNDRFWRIVLYCCWLSSFKSLRDANKFDIYINNQNYATCVGLVIFKHAKYEVRNTTYFKQKTVKKNFFKNE